MAKWLAKEFDWDTGRYTGRYYDIAEVGIVAVFVDSFYGDDASADPEDPDLPLKTLGAAITYLNTNGANGSRIFMNGIFSETLPAQTYWYRFIGCGGGRNGKAIFWKGITALPVISKSLTVIENIQFLNYELTLNASNVNLTYYAVGCFFDTTFISLHNTISLSPLFYYCIFKDCMFRGNTTSEIMSFYCIIYNLNVFSTQNVVLNGTHNYYFTKSVNTLSNRSSFSLLIRGDLGLADVAHFLNIENNDFNVRTTSPLLFKGALDPIYGTPTSIGGVRVGLPYNGNAVEFSTAGGAIITDLTLDAFGKYTITPPNTHGTLESGLMDLGNIYPLENIDLFNVFDFASGEITQGVFETFSSPRMALTIKLKYGLTSAEVDDCPWLLIEYGKQPTFSGTGASRVGNAADTFDPDTFQTITCRYMKLFVTLQNNS